MTANTPTDPQLERKAAAPTRDEPTGSWAAAATSRRANLAFSLSPRNIGAVYVLIVICIVFSIWAPQTFPQIATVKQVLDNNAITALAALALIVPLSAGVFDLSFAYVMSLSGVTAAHFVAANNMNVFLAALIGIGAALVIGVINGLVHRHAGHRVAGAGLYQLRDR
jgi:ribose transport system permease protein